jgi:hypothetical protein
MEGEDNMTRSYMTLLLVVLVTAFILTTVVPAGAQSDRLKKGAVIGGGLGLLFGDGLGGVIKGATVGGGVGAVTGEGPQAEEARRKARTGAAVGAGAGLLFGDGLGDALGGAILGGSAGAIYGDTRNR